MVTVKNVSQLKKALQKGAEYRVIAHRVHPEYVGLVRVVNKVQTNCVYSKIKDQPEHRYSVINYGLGVRTDFLKPDNYEFGDTVKVFLDKGNRAEPSYEFEILKSGD